LVHRRVRHQRLARGEGAVGGVNLKKAGLTLHEVNKP
jgi:hypothetical protein